jgi:hypothetical protein
MLETQDALASNEKLAREVIGPGTDDIDRLAHR